jgi:hypothetical protein
VSITSIKFKLTLSPAFDLDVLRRLVVNKGKCILHEIASLLFHFVPTNSCSKCCTNHTLNCPFYYMRHDSLRATGVRLFANGYGKTHGKKLSAKRYFADGRKRVHSKELFCRRPKRAHNNYLLTPFRDQQVHERSSLQLLCSRRSDRLCRAVGPGCRDEPAVDLQTSAREGPHRS